MYDIVIKGTDYDIQDLTLEKLKSWLELLGLFYLPSINWETLENEGKLSQKIENYTLEIVKKDSRKVDEETEEKKEEIPKKTKVK